MVQPQDGNRNCISEALAKAGSGLASSSPRSSFFPFLLKFSWFTMLCQYLLHSNALATQDEKESAASHGNAQMFVGTEASVLH